MSAGFVFDDGGRAVSGRKGFAGDCVCRAIAIAAELPYEQVYRRLAKERGEQRATSRTGKKAVSARHGINTGRKWFKDYMASLGFEWVPTMGIGTGCKVHLCAEELPAGRIIAAVSKHYVAMIDGVLHDTLDPSRGGRRCVYGYWHKARGETPNA